MALIYLVTIVTGIILGAYLLLSAAHLSDKISAKSAETSNTTEPVTSPTTIEALTPSNTSKTVTTSNTEAKMIATIKHYHKVGGKILGYTLVIGSLLAVARASTLAEFEVGSDDSIPVQARRSLLMKNLVRPLLFFLIVGVSAALGQPRISGPTAPYVLEVFAILVALFLAGLRVPLLAAAGATPASL
ncbi:hypothetical protein CSUI_007788 [Cystoisospora suis]|uniref:Transmembrane protein n=1 Tax=Cystoisospora suis TaxID=483139 RepID=A0A2C6JSU7_9APIC|nr:hypothetical protein CSUI_007788 [Cystoisospora suis]